MKLRFPFFHTTDVQASDEALAVRDARIRELEDTCTELKQTKARQAELISELECNVGLNSNHHQQASLKLRSGNPPAPKRTNVKGRKPGGKDWNEQLQHLLSTNCR